MKATKKILEARLQHFNEIVGSDFVLDYVKEYGGYRIENKSGSYEPFGSSRYSASEFETLINFAIRAIKLDRDNGKPNHIYWPLSKSDYIKNSEPIGE